MPPQSVSTALMSVLDGVTACFYWKEEREGEKVKKRKRFGRSECRYAIFCLSFPFPPVFPSFCLYIPPFFPVSSMCSACGVRDGMSV